MASEQTELKELLDAQGKAWETFKKENDAALKKGGFMRQKQKDNFSMRLKSVGGHFTAAQLATVQQVAEKYGKDKHRWDDVAPFILNLQTPQYYNDPVVKYGYMRGTETVGYVARIRDRWRQYRGVARGGSCSVFSFSSATFRAWLSR